MNAAKFAEQWIEAWNSHDLGGILAHYCDDFEITTPMIKVMLGGGNGKLKGKAAIGAYWQAALDKTPELNFRLLDVTEGVDSIAIYYTSVLDKLAIEVMFFEEELQPGRGGNDTNNNYDKKVSRVVVHYR